MTLGAVHICPSSGTSRLIRAECMGAGYLSGAEWVKEKGISEVEEERNHVAIYHSLPVFK